ncbi:Gfo/Idh/MocA family protein [Paramagnetospirillum kuznetsovii]|uniref:Gfo/Idh/MocA family protein n=1 Tax=Paramagnetospirillum kuznetsovii TaxID=2053833 RepID=UPI001EFCE1E3|nr:Gfo/Idh/MocA family oxidoreductase [Paramagnetospirillum kuznetsovii]
MRYLVIGSGSIGKRHTRNLRAIGVPSSDIFAIDTRADRRREIEEIGINTSFASFDEALAAGHYDAALVCSPTSLHIPQATVLAKRGTHILMEKPLAHDLAGIVDLKQAVADNGVQVVMAYIFRFAPTVAKAKELVDSGIIGKVLYARGEFSEYLPDWHPYEDYRTFYMAEKSQGGGSILDQSHIMDLVHYLLGGFASVSCFNAHVSGLDLKADDIAEMIVRLKSGVVASIHTDIFGRDHKKSLEIKGEHGNILWDHYAGAVTHYDAETKVSRVFKKFPADFNLAYIAELKHFIACCEGKEKPLATLQEGIETMELILAAERSHQSGRIEVV